MQGYLQIQAGTRLFCYQFVYWKDWTYRTTIKIEPFDYGSAFYTYYTECRRYLFIISVIKKIARLPVLNQQTNITAQIRWFGTWELGIFVMVLCSIFYKIVLTLIYCYFSSPQWIFSSHGKKFLDWDIIQIKNKFICFVLLLVKYVHPWF